MAQAKRKFIRSSSSRRLHTDLIGACRELHTLDLGLQNLHQKFGDDADSRDDYLAMCDRRLRTLEVLAAGPAKKTADIAAKAEALLERSVQEAYEHAVKIGASLANDVLRVSNQLGSPKQIAALGSSPSDARTLICLYDAYIAAAEAVQGAANMPRAKGAAEAILDLEWDALTKKAGAVARQLSAMTLVEESQVEQRAHVLVVWAFQSGESLNGIIRTFADAATVEQQSSRVGA